MLILPSLRSLPVWLSLTSCGAPVQPNCYARVITVQNKKKIVIYSKKDIAVGEVRLLLPSFTLGRPLGCRHEVNDRV